MSNAKLVVEASPESFNNLPHISEVEPVNERDISLLSDIRDVLEKHGALNRFGLQLLHRHFDLKNGEILHEETDEEGRISTIKPIQSEKILNKISEQSITFTTVFFPALEEGHPHGVVTLACAISCASHSYGKVHNVT